jgi:Fur family ferric uptake transcriptional regulator
MSDVFDKLQSTLKAHQLSVTTPRRVVFEALLGKEPQSIHTLLATCKQQIDRATLYRTVTLFEKLGIIQRLQIGWKYKLELSNSFQNHHHHLSCRKCSAIIPLPEDEQLENRLNQLASTIGFYPEDHQIEIRGLCKECQK